MTTSQNATAPKRQGRCYSLKGGIVIDGTKYPDFYSSTHYGSVDGLLGANCRHSFGPYVHGAKRAYSPNPQHASGLSNDEVYQLTQKQRYIERQIRADKREIIGAREGLAINETLENRANLARAEEKLKQRQASMREFIKESNAKSKTGEPILHRQPNREWAEDMPKVKQFGRSVDDVLKMTSVQKRMSSIGVTDESAKQRLSKVLVQHGLNESTFENLSKSEQTSIIKEALPPKKLKRHREIDVGGIFGQVDAKLHVEQPETRFIPETKLIEEIVFAGKGTSTEYRKSKVW